MASHLDDLAHEVVVQSAPEGTCCSASCSPVGRWSTIAGGEIVEVERFKELAHFAGGQRK